MTILQLNLNNTYIQKLVEEMLFDTSKDLQISDQDYGLWFIDQLDDPQRYDGCKVTLKVKYLDRIRNYRDGALMGRQAMVCCSNDLQNIGITCTDLDLKKVERNRFYYLTGIMQTLRDEEGRAVCVLRTQDIQDAPAPDDEYVNFN